MTVFISSPNNLFSHRKRVFFSDCLLVFVLCVFLPNTDLMRCFYRNQEPINQYERLEGHDSPGRSPDSTAKGVLDKEVSHQGASNDVAPNEFVT